MPKKPQTFSSMFKSSKAERANEDDTLPLKEENNDPPADGKTIVAMQGLEQTTIEPVVGWLVVINGEGKGSSIPIMAGVNSIGRGHNNRIVLNFNDHRISTHNHCCIIYDPKAHDYFFKHENGKNLSYLNDKTVLTTEKLTSYNIIQLGDTHLLFIALCGELFQWG